MKKWYIILIFFIVNYVSPNKAQDLLFQVPYEAPQVTQALIDLNKTVPRSVINEFARHIKGPRPHITGLQGALSFLINL